VKWSVCAGERTIYYGLDQGYAAVTMPCGTGMGTSLPRRGCGDEIVCGSDGAECAGASDALVKEIQERVQSFADWPE